MGTLTEKRTGTTEKRRRAFLDALRVNGGNVSATCEQKRVGRSTVYEWRDCAADFAAAWDDIVEATTEDAESELYRRAVKGTERPVYQGGKLVGHVREYSDACLMFFLKARRPALYNQAQRIEETTPDGQCRRVEFTLNLGDRHLTETIPDEPDTPTRPR